MDNPELIFRLETRDGQGPYVGSSRFAQSVENNQDYYSRNLHPGPYEDDLDDYNYKDIFGFITLADARRWWFDVADLRRWNKDGLRLAIWPSHLSTRIKKGKNQIAFKRPNVKPFYLPAYAIHEISEEVIRDVVKDHFNVDE